MLNDFANDSMGDVYKELQSSSAARTHSQIRPRQYSIEYVDKLITDNSLIEKLNSTVPSESTKLLPNLTGVSLTKEKKLTDALVNFNWSERARIAGYLANRYGAAYLVLDVNDGRSYDQEVNYKVRPQITRTYILTQNNLHPCEHEYSDFDYEEAEFYTMQRNGQVDKVHKSRVLPFYGTRLYGRSLRNHGMYHRPYWVKSFPALEHYNMGLKATVDMLQDADVFIYKYKGFHDLLEQARGLDCNNEQVTKQLVQRLRMLAQGKSITDAMILDMDNEEGEFIQRDFSHVKEMIETLRLAFAEKTDFPQSILFSSSEAGLFSDTGASDRYSMASLVSKYQREQHVPNLKKLFTILEPRTKGYVISFPSTAEHTIKENAETQFTQAKALSALVVSGILSQSQAAAYYGERHMISHVQLTEAEIKAANELEPPSATPPKDESSNSNGSGSVNKNVSGNAGKGIAKSN